MDWNELIAIATVIGTFFSMCALVTTAVYVVAVVRAYERDSYLGVTSELFGIFQTPEFMAAQFWLIYKLDSRTWPEFVKGHSNDLGQSSFHRVGTFYDRVGTLLRRKLITPDDILPTVGPYAIAVWNKIEPLVHEARRLENSTLFIDFEKMLPDCYECYVPNLATESVRPFELQQPRPPAQKPVDERITPEEVLRLQGQGAPLLLLDVRQPSNISSDPRTLPDAVVIPPAQIEQRFAELPRDKEIVAYCA
jgi:hypothetical protein